LKGVEGIPSSFGVTIESESANFCLRTEYISGSLLSEVSNKLSVTKLLRSGFQAFQILQEMHKRGVVHGDVRPWNVICGERRVWLIDFEEARTFRHLPGPITAYRKRRSPHDEVYWVLRDIKDLLSTILFSFSESRSLIARWISMASPMLVRKFDIPSPGHGVLRSNSQKESGPEERNE
jgi:hypothetical protein